jgi:hypothetical protein
VIADFSSGQLSKITSGMTLTIVGEAPSEDLHYYPDYNTITQNSAGDITFDCESGKTHIYVSEPYYEVDFLEDNQLVHNYGGYYIGSLKG